VRSLLETNRSYLLRHKLHEPLPKEGPPEFLQLSHWALRFLSFWRLNIWQNTPIALSFSSAQIVDSACRIRTVSVNSSSRYLGSRRLFFNWFHSLQRRASDPQLPLECGPARIASNFSSIAKALSAHRSDPQFPCVSKFCRSDRGPRTQSCAWTWWRSKEGRALDA